MYNPYSVGRWYRFRIESHDGHIILKKSDIPNAIIEFDHLRLPREYRVLDVVRDINSIQTKDGDNVYFGSNYIFRDGEQGTQLPSPESFDYAYIYIFARKIKR